MPERPKLAVVLGAGASHDVCPDADTGTISDPQWRPPIVATMFGRGALDRVLPGHPEAAALMSIIRTEVRAGVTFEESLRRCADSEDPRVQRLVPFVPIALHEFFFRVSNEYTWEAINYSHLIGRTIGQGIQTAYITLNYDTLLEMSLRKITGVTFDSAESYICSPDWILVKLHGSVGWGYPWPTDEWIPNMVMAARSNKPPERRSEEIQVGLRREMYRNGRTRELFYPALALPVVGKSGFVCPPSHVEALRQFLSDCRDFLFIGFSASDEDLLDLLNETIGNVYPQVAVVTGGDLVEVAQRLVTKLPQCNVTFDIGRRGFNDGFSHFLEKDLDRVLRPLTA